MTLMLHMGAETVDFPMLANIEPPEPTQTHVPLAHHTFVDMVKFALDYYGHEVVEEHHAIAHEGMRYFGLLTLKSPYGEYTDTLGLRNSNDRKFPAGIAYGSRVFVCDNLAFMGEHVIKRRHTKKLHRELPALISDIVRPLTDRRKQQHAVIERFQETVVPDELADHAIMSMYREGVLNVQRIADVNRQWHEPDFDWGDKTAFRLMNAATYALRGRVSEDPRTTTKLHNVIEGTCERLN